MSDIAIQVKNLGKKYRIQHQTPDRHSTLRDVIANSVSARLRGLRKLGKLKNGPREESEDFWALRDVSFEVQRGEVLGIIGRNGAGKSTLLKILSRITEPTEGQIEIEGRVASLLEVGTGFHPELTGRENIFLNGAILGMSRKEIRGKFDEIVAFAEVQQFLDTPVKRYSSGMYVRLAFAVAAHLDPEILIVDEVLAVGDAEFQQKCLGKMDSVAKTQGRTVLFVSHNMPAIRQLCARALMLDAGHVHADGLPTDVVGEYLSDARRGRFVELADWKDRATTDEARIVKVEITDDRGGAGCVAFGGELIIRIHVMVNKPLQDPTFGVLVHDSMGGALLDLRSQNEGMRLGLVTKSIILEMRVPGITLYPGRYFLSPWISDWETKRDIDFPRHCCVLDVLPAALELQDLKLDPLWGKLFVKSKWKAEPA